LGENIEEAHATKEHIQEVNVQANLGSGKPEEENEHHGKVEVYEDDQDNTRKDPTKDLTTPNSKTEAGCIIRYNVSSIPKNEKMQHDKNSTFNRAKVPDTSETFMTHSRQDFQTASLVKRPWPFCVFPGTVV
jgi:cytoskeleton-associated protein 2